MNVSNCVSHGHFKTFYINNKGGKRVSRLFTVLQSQGTCFSVLMSLFDDLP